MTTRSRSRSSSEYSNNYNNQEQNTDAQQINYKKEKPEHRAEDHLEKFQESLEKVDANVAADFRNEKNLLEYKPEERVKHMETYVEAFNDTDHSSFKDRKQAATDITKNTFKHVYNDFEALEASNAEKVPDDLKKIFKKEGITEFRLNEKTGNIEFDFKDLKQLERVSTRSRRQNHVLRTAGADRTTSTNSAAGDSKDKKLESDTALLQAEEDHSGGAVQEAYKSGIAKSLEHDNRNPRRKDYSQDTTRASNRGKSIRQCAPGNKRE